MDRTFGLRHFDPGLVPAPADPRPDVQAVVRRPLTVQHVEVVGPESDDEEDEVADSLSLGLEEALGVAGPDLEPDVD